MGRGSKAAGNIVLIGFMGSGKSEVGRRLAGRLGRPFVDTDEIVEGSGLSIPDIFAGEGEAGFRRRERDAVRRAAAARGAVIATGGGAVLAPENVSALKQRGVLVYLQVGAAELARRLDDAEGRPLLVGEDERPGTEDPGVRRERRRRRVRRLLQARVPSYEGVADHVVPCKRLGPDEVCDEILHRLGLDRTGPGPEDRIEVATEPAYTVTVGRGLLERLSALVAPPKGCEKACVVSHPRVWRLWGQRLTEGLDGWGVEVTHFTFPQGEGRKTPETVTKLHRRLASSRFHRSDLLVALGGGVVGDVTAFAASTYGRGIGVLQVPTTLLAMVDSSVGGKTGVNLPEGKNLVGTFAQPTAVVADLDTLTTLADRELRGGLAEVVKYALIADPDLGDLAVSKVEDVFARGDVLGSLVARSVRIKSDVVAEDPKEAGRRAILNYGHTLGHALEALSTAGKLRAGTLHHGEAISVGMVFAAHVSEGCGLAADGLVEDHLDRLGALGLPTSVSGVSWEDVEPYVALDKKYTGGLRLVLLEAPGKPVVRGDVPREALQDALARVTEDA